MKYVVALGELNILNASCKRKGLGYSKTAQSTIPVIHNARIFHVAERGGTLPKVHLR